MFEVHCLNCEKKVFRCNIKDIISMQCDCGTKLFWNNQPTPYCKVIEKVLFEKRSISAHRDEFRDYIVARYGDTKKRKNKCKKKK